MYCVLYFKNVYEMAELFELPTIAKINLKSNLKCLVLSE